MLQNATSGPRTVSGPRSSTTPVSFDVTQPSYVRFNVVAEEAD